MVIDIRPLLKYHLQFIYDFITDDDYKQLEEAIEDIIGSGCEHDKVSRLLEILDRVVRNAYASGVADGYEKAKSPAFTYPIYYIIPADNSTQDIIKWKKWKVEVNTTGREDSLQTE